MKIKLFEEALQNFCEVCIDMKSNEKAFQAYYAHFVIKKLEESIPLKDAIKLVHREGHLNNQALIELAGNAEIFAQAPWEKFPDLSISHFPIDNRHSNTREFNFEELKGKTNTTADWLLAQSIVTEFKVTSSVLKSKQQEKDVRKDLIKLALFASARNAALKQFPIQKKFEICMVILDNHPKRSLSNDPQYRFGGTAMNNLLDFGSSWPENIPTPIVYVLLKWDDGNGLKPKFDKYVNWKKVN